MKLIKCKNCNLPLACIIATKGFEVYEKSILCKNCYLEEYAEE